jgi:hypothetical protein
VTGKTDEGETGDHNLRSAAFARDFPSIAAGAAGRTGAAIEFVSDATIGIGEA